MHHVYIDKYSNLDSFLHLLDPRTKIVTFLYFVFIIVLTPIVAKIQFVVYFFIIIFLVLLSKIPIIHFIKNVFNILPLIFFIIVSTLFLKGANEDVIYQYLGLSITSKSLNLSLGVIIKAIFSITLLTLLSATTSFNLLLKGFEKLKFPKIIILILSFMYRYIFVLVDELQKMQLSVELKNFRKRNIFKFKILTNIVGSLFLRAYERAERIYFSMCSRLFNGNIKTFNKLQFKKVDIYFLLAMTIFLTIINVVLFI